MDNEIDYGSLPGGALVLGPGGGRGMMFQGIRGLLFGASPERSRRGALWDRALSGERSDLIGLEECSA